MKSAWLAAAMLLLSPSTLAWAAEPVPARAALLERWSELVQEDPVDLAKQGRVRKPELFNALAEVNPGQEKQVDTIVGAFEICIAEASFEQSRRRLLEVAASMTDAELLALVRYEEEIRAQEINPRRKSTHADTLARLASEAPLQKLNDGLSRIGEGGVSDATMRKTEDCVATLKAAFAREGLRFPQRG
jgi:hypothetical protein